jgi:hypothetical protein
LWLFARFVTLCENRVSQLRSKFFTKRQEIFSRKDAKSQRKQSFFGFNSKLQKLLILFARFAALRETAFLVYPV